MSLNKYFYCILSSILLFFLAAGMGYAGKPFELTIMHINDTHGHIDPSVLRLRILTDEPFMTRVEAGGFARIAAKIRAVRLEKTNTILLHGGDVFTGTLYFAKYSGRADLDLMKYMKFDVMVLGNHEFDKGPGVLGSFIDDAGKDMPVISANIDFSSEPALNGKVLPFAVKSFGDEKVAIIGLTTPDTPSISMPGNNLKFRDIEQSMDTVRSIVNKLNLDGINKIILLTHLGYKTDLELAQKITGIDLIVGGHSHTLLGDFGRLGLEPGGPYPSVVTNPVSGEAVYVVQSWEWGKVFGEMDVKFDGNGRIAGVFPEEKILVGENFERETKAESNKNYTGPENERIRSIIERDPCLEIVRDDPGATAILEPYSKGIMELSKKIIGKAGEDLSKPVMGQIIADAMIWKSRLIGQDVSISFMNTGGVRSDIPVGDISVGKIYEVQPFGDTLYVMDLTGAQIKEALEQGSDKGYPYVGGIRYTVAMGNPAGSRITSLEIRGKDGVFRPAGMGKIYRAALQSYMAKGGDNYSVFRDSVLFKYDTGFVDADILMEYLTGVKGWNAGERAGATVK